MIRGISGLLRRTSDTVKKGSESVQSQEFNGSVLESTDANRQS